MTDEYKTIPNSYLGDVQWYSHVYWGTYEFIAQSMLTMSPRPPNWHDLRFLQARTTGANALWEWFDEIMLPDGRLALELNMDDTWGDSIAVIETHFEYGEEISDEDFLRLIDDFIAYARTRRLVDSNKREGAEISNEELEQMLSYESPEEKAFWDSFPDVKKEASGLPHYLWIESLEFLEPEPNDDWIPWPAELP